MGYFLYKIGEALVDLSDHCRHANHAHKALKQAKQSEKKKKQTQGFSRSLKSKCGKIFVELESLGGKLSGSQCRCL